MNPSQPPDRPHLAGDSHGLDLVVVERFDLRTAADRLLSGRVAVGMVGVVRSRDRRRHRPFRRQRERPQRSCRPIQTISGLDSSWVKLRTADTHLKSTAGSRP